MSEIVSKPMKRLLVSRKLAFVVSVIGGLGLILIMAWSEHRHNADKTDETKQEQEVLAKQLAESPSGNELDAVLQFQKTEAERSLQQQPPEDRTVPNGATDIEQELKQELDQPFVTEQAASAGTGEDLQQTKEEELAASAYGSTMVAVKRSGAVRSTLEDVTDSFEPQAEKRANPLELAESARAIMRENQPPTTQTQNERNKAFLSTAGTRQGEIFVEPGRSGRVLHEGSVIPAVVARAVNSDLPGQVELRTTRDVYDSVNGKTLVIPRGTRAIGAYSSDVTAGQNRVLVAFHRLIFPDGRTVYLGNAQGTDREGAAGFHDRVNTHFWKMVGSSFLLAAIAQASGDNGSTTLNIGGASGSSSNPAGEIMVRTSETVLGKYTNMQPTIEIRPGTRVNITVNKDIVL